MKPASERGPVPHEEPEAPANLANSFNISDGLAKGAHETTNSEAQPSLADEDGPVNESCARKRSPSPSAVSTASSGSPLIRSDSSTSSSSMSVSGGPTRANPAQRKHQHPSNQHQPGAGPLKRPPAPTSIAAAQLQQQQGLHAPSHQLDSPSRSHQKYPNCNKLAHMAKFQAKSKHQEKMPSYRLGGINAAETSAESAAANQQHEQDRLKRKSAQCGAAEGNGKSFGYNLGKTLAFRASRFSEFWSVNKMRYMNLACLLMTLVCLVTILLFSKTTLFSNSNSLALSESSTTRLGQHHHQGAADSLLAEAEPLRLKQRRKILQNGDNRDQDRREDDGEQEAPVESIDSMDRQAFVRGPGQRLTGDDRDEATGHEDSSSKTSADGPRLASSDGFNLFDERHDDDASGADHGSSSKRSLDEMILDARRQLKRQQEEEQEMDQKESNLNKNSLPDTLSSLPESSSIGDGVGGANKRPGSITNPLPISQVLQDLDGFGLFKLIKSRLIDQLEKQNLSSRPATIMRSKNGATIIMSFSSPTDAAPNTTGNSNSTTAPSELASEVLPSFLRDLLPPMLTRVGGGAGGLGSSLFDRRPSGFAAITINSEPTLSIRSSGLPFGGAAGFESSFGGIPLMGPPSPFSFALSPASISATPNQRPPLIMASGGGLGGTVTSSGGGLMSMLLRASNELANQMRQQLEQANNQTTTTQAGPNGTVNEQEASQQVKVIQLFGGPPEQVAESGAKNDSTKLATATNSSAANGDELDTFGFGRPISAPSSTRQATTIRLPLASSSPFDSIFSTRRSAGPMGGGSMVMIESSSSGLPSIMGAGDSPGSPLASVFGPNPAFMGPFESDGMLQAMPLKPFPILPNVFLLGAGGHHQRAHHRAGGFPMPVNPILRSILNNVMSDLSQSALASEGPTTTVAGRSGAGKHAQPELAAKPSGSGGSGRRNDNQDDSEWDELVPAAHELRAKSRTRSRAVDQPDLVGDSSDEPQTAASQEPPASGSPFRFQAATSAGNSMFEQMFEHLNSGGAGPGRPQLHHQHTFGGTIRQTIHGPNGLTAERVIGLAPPAGSKQRHYTHKGTFQTVAPGVRSQSLSRMDTPDNHNNNRLRSSSGSFERLIGADLGPELGQARFGPPQPVQPMNFISHLLGHELAGEQQDDEPPSRRGFRATLRSLRPVRAELMDRSDGTELDDDADAEPANVNVFPPRVTSARIRLLSPHDPPVPQRFRLMLNVKQQSAEPGDELGEPTNVAQARSKLLPVASPFTSPSSPLFGFPVMKAPAQMSAASAPSTSSPPLETRGSAELEREQTAGNDETPASAASGSHRRQRSFVYHSNHEIAQNQARPRVAQQTSKQQLDAPRHSHSQGQGNQPAEPRSASSTNHQSHQQQQQQQAAAAPLPPAASVVMGRRLDDFIERRK